MRDPNYKPINTAMKMAGPMFADEVQGMRATRYCAGYGYIKE